MSKQSKKKSTKKRKKSSHLSLSKILNRNKVNINLEANYIMKRALNHETKIVSLLGLILFSTETGDAWILDPKDGLSLCLLKNGEEQEFNIYESTSELKIEWNSNYDIEDEKFIIYSPTGQIKTIIGYPTEKILEIISLTELENSKN